MGDIIIAILLIVIVAAWIEMTSVCMINLARIEKAPVKETLPGLFLSSPFDGLRSFGMIESPPEVKA